MLKEIEIKNEAQVEQINRLACKAPYEVWSSSGAIMLVGRKAQVVVEDDVAPRAFDKLVAKMA